MQSNLETCYLPLRSLPSPLLKWYHKSHRTLPWREYPTPYHVWVSEIMLQQTRVEAVLPYFERFIQALPTVKALSQVPDDMLMKLWEGLGYYSRARNLKKAAQILVEKYNGQLPASYEALLRLPGIGEYTAGAIASIAFGLPVPAVDGNVLRVATRLCADDADISQQKVKRLYRQLISEIIPIGEASPFNQAFMELGATVCLPNGVPRCSLCPAQKFCTAFAQGNPQAYPVKGEKKPRRQEHLHVYLFVCDNRVALRRRPPHGLLAGMWEFPHWPAKEENRGEDFSLILPYIENQVELGSSRHIFTHICWNMTGTLMQTRPFSLPEGWCWADRQALAKEIALPSAFQYYTQQLLLRNDF